MNQKARIAHVATIIITAGAAFGPARAYAVGQFVIRDIQILGVHRLESSTVSAYLPMKPGDIFTQDRSSESIRALYATGLFSDVNISTVNDQVMVSVVERSTISNVDFAGLHEFDKENLSKALKTVGLAAGRSFDKATISRAEQELKRQYLMRGFYSAEVATTLTPITQDRVTVLFSVIEGPSAKIRQINFIGNKVVPTSTLIDEMQLSTPNWFSWYSKNDLYSKEKLTGDLEKIRSYYLNRGFLAFNIESTQVSISPDRNDMYVTLTLHEGVPYTISSIRFSGNLLEREPELRSLLRIKSGQLFSAEQLQASTKLIVDKLGEYGYAFATVNAAPEIDQDHHSVALTIQIDPGKRVYVRRIDVFGNTRTRDEVIRREMRQFENAWFDSNAVRLSKDRVNRLGYFTDVDVTTVAVEGAKDQVDLAIKVAEKPTGAITLGAGFSSTDKIVLSGGVTQDNVFGSGTSLGVNVNTAKTYRTLSVSQTDPYFTIDGVQRITDIYYKTSYPLYYSSDSSFKILTMGVDTKFGIPFSESDMVYFGVGFEQDHLTIDSSTPQSYKDYVNSFGRVSNNVPFTVGWKRDNRDSSLVPSRGYLLQTNAEIGTPLGSTEYFKTDVTAQYYYSFSRGFILGMNFQGGYGQGIAGKAYPIFKNYYAGGIGSVRGYESSSLGPRDKSTNDPIGGSRMLVGNIELTVPLPGTGYDRTLRVFTFVDGGNVWGNEGNSTGANGLRYSYGAGLEWISPIGPLKLSLGFPIVRHTDDTYQKFQFQIGTSF